MTPAEFREARRKLGLSHRQLAAALKVTTVTVQRYAMESTRRSRRPIPPIVEELMRRLLADHAARGTVALQTIDVVDEVS
jgi:DNA-binding transcriptional regulator YiaG